MASRKRAKARPQTAQRTSRKRPTRKMSPNAKFLTWLSAAVLLITGLIWFTNRDSAPATPAAANERLVRADSHRLGEPAADGKVTLVEFLDFECEACRAAYPGVEQIREEYQGKITYVLRYFPLPGHRNGLPAARAAQAAANQGKLEPMYRKMFETQETWGEQQQDLSSLFESYARELGLNMDTFKADAASPETAARVNADLADGKALGVTGTPTFFLNGEKFTGRPDYAGLKAAIDRALAA
jgi:protein-disulfide isomerase